MFSYEVESNGRYIHSKSELNFLNALKETWDKRKINLPTGTEVFRAQIDHIEKFTRDDEGIIESMEILPSEDQRLFPKKEYAVEGRLNPKGILVFYASMSKETAMSELRPWVKSKITVGTFRTKRDLTVLDLTLDSPKDIPEDDSDEKKENFVWGDINYSFSKPIVNSETSAEYVPTQILAEFFKKNGFNAIIHKSSLGKEKNIVFFRSDYLELISKEVKEVSAVNYKFHNAF
ncbi:RES domain-containing protein [Gracilimonas mengyeensis]|uniref:RES domain-containing protein n=2 Tax=Gracilimonas mengyeensis TaxID=1302730 RepID=A0A521ETD5_9BACT|nr:RES domain-containing protein [Gracilimonas mengyeensis]